MAFKRVRRSNFDRILRFVVSRIKKHRSITLVQLSRTLCSSFGVEYFRKRQNMNLLMNVVEYLLYTKRLVVVNPNENLRLHPVIYHIITQELLLKFKDAFHSNPSNILAQNICVKFDPFYVALSRKIVPHHRFSNSIKGSGNPIGNQRNSGRCWIFACLNVIRVPFMKTYSIKHFEFSQAYLFFWDKIERSNYFLNAIVSTAKNGHALNSRTIMCLLQKPIEDGGYWTMAVNIIKKYGLMPKLNFPECYSSEDSRDLNEILNSKLRQFAIVLLDMVTNNATTTEIEKEIKSDMCIVYRIVGICLDIPKQTFKWYYRVDENQPFLYQNITPLEFYKTLVKPTFNVEDKVSLISYPKTNDSFGQLFTLDLIGNVTNGSKIVYNNQPIEVLLEACKQSISTLGEPVWYSCEVNQRFSSELGCEDLKIHDLKSLFGTDISITMSKSERILYRDSSPTHAMVLTGVHIEQNGEVTRWRVENSWGKHSNMNGHLMMTTEWFKEYVFEVVVDKKLLPKYVLDVFNQEPIILPIWDQLGTLSFVR